MSTKERALGTQDCGHEISMSRPAAGEAGATGDWRTARPVLDRERCLAVKPGVRVVTADVSGAAAQVGLVVGGAPMVSTAILGAFAAATELISMECLREAIGAAFPASAAKTNYDAAALARQGTQA